MTRPRRVLSAALQTTLIGALGGFLGFVLSEMLRTPYSDDDGAALIGTVIWAATLVVPLSLALLIGENVLGLRGRWFKGVGRLVLPALIVGALSGLAAQLFYSFGLAVLGEGPQRLLRALGWALLGVGVGALLGFSERSAAKAARGALGGAIGGFLGGLLFDSFAAVSFGESDTGLLPRLVGLTLLGAAIGFMLRLSQQLLSRAWLTATTTGRYEGQQYLLQKPRVTLGRSDANDIALYHDETAPLQAGELRRDGENWHWAGEGLVNGQAVRQARLNSGDRLRVGSTEFVFQTKGGAAQAEATLAQGLSLHGNRETLPLPLPLRRVTLGTQGEVRLTGQGVQARHAELSVQGGEVQLKALAPLKVDGQVLTPGQTRVLRVGELLEIGDEPYAVIKDDR